MFLHMAAPQGAAWEFFLLFVVIVSAPRLAERVRLPGIVGLLLGGFAIGPHGLGLITADHATIPELGQLGLLYLMFLAGLELDLTLLRTYRRSAVAFGLLTFSIPMVLGTALGIVLGWSAVSALLLGSLLASHTLVTYPLIRERGLGADPAVATAVGATVLTDTLALVVLAAVAGTVQGTGSGLQIGIQITIGLIVLVGATLVVLPWLVRWAFRRLGAHRPIRYGLLVAAFLAAAVLAEVFGIEGIVGAFFAGVALNRIVPNASPLMARVEFFGSALFIPVFIISIGLILDPTVLIQPATLGLAGLLVAACLGGKALAAWAARMLLGFSGPQSGVMFALTTPQAAATLAATTVGYQIGLLQTAVVNAVLILILMSLIVSPVAARIAAPRVPVREADDLLGARVMVAVADVGDTARTHALLRIAVRIAREDGGTVLPVLLRHESDPPSEQGAALASLGAAASLAGVDGDATVVVDRSRAHGAVHAAVAARATIVLTSGHDGGPVFGSWTDALAAAAAVPFALVGGHGPVRRGVLVDDLTAPESARMLAAELARRIGNGRTGPSDEQDPAGGGVGTVVVRPVSGWTIPEPVLPAGGLTVTVPPAASAGEGIPNWVPVAATPGGRRRQRPRAPDAGQSG